MYFFFVLALNSDTCTNTDVYEEKGVDEDMGFKLEVPITDSESKQQIRESVIRKVQELAEKYGLNVGEQ